VNFTCSSPYNCTGYSISKSLNCPPEIECPPTRNVTNINFIYVVRPPYTSGVEGVKQALNDYYLVGYEINSLNITTIYVQDTYVHGQQYKKSAINV
jgi:hypothetical protein